MSKITKKMTGHRYSTADQRFYVETDFTNGRIYLTPPGEDIEGDIGCMRDFGRAILRACDDFERHQK